MEADRSASMFVSELIELVKQSFLDGIDASFAVQFDVLEPGFVSHVAVEVGGGQGAAFGVIVDVVTLADGGFVLVVGAGLQFAAAYPALVSIGLDGVDEDIVGVVV